MEYGEGKGNSVTNKQRILKMVLRWPEDITIAEALYHVQALKNIDAGLRDLDEGRVLDHEDVLDDFEQRCRVEEDQVVMVATDQD